MTLGCGVLAEGALADLPEVSAPGVLLAIDVELGGALSLPQAQDAWVDVADIEITTSFAAVSIRAETA